ncbi:MAG: DUF6665 family protein [Paracoccus sp. (in: a-proteobacteria)]
MSRFLARVEWAHALRMSGTEALEVELQAERASALGTGGRRLEQALADLRAAEAGARPARLAMARRRAWEFMVQREAAGLRDWPAVVRLYGIPPEVLHGMGAVPPK